MKLTSIAFAHDGLIPQFFTCDGKNTHPPLAFHEVPAETQTLALIMDDPDVPRDRIPDGVFDHWVVFNIPPKTTGVSENGELPGTYGVNTAGKNAYAGPCPPDREHRYFFRLYALDTHIALTKGATKKELLEAMDGHIIAEAELMARYNRPANE